MTELFVDANGMILGDMNQPPKPFYVSPGDTPNQLKERNPYLPKIYMEPGRDLYLSLLTKLHLHYDDGDIRFEIPCVQSTSVSGRSSASLTYQTVQHVGASLCDPFVNDWSKATRQAMELMHLFEQQNPSAIKAQILQKQLTHDELAKISPTLVGFRDKSKPLELLGEAEANSYFAKIAAEGHRDQVDFDQNTFIQMAKYVGKTTIFGIGISKEFLYGERENLSADVRDTMKYEVTVSFSRRSDIAQPGQH